MLSNNALCRAQITQQGTPTLLVAGLVDGASAENIDRPKLIDIRSYWADDWQNVRMYGRGEPSTPSDHNLSVGQRPAAFASLSVGRADWI